MIARVLIRCPATGRKTPTGYRMGSVQLAAANLRYAFRCPSCGDVHQWVRADAWRDGAPEPAHADPLGAAA